MENTIDATEKVIEYPLSDTDINHLLHPPTHVFIYPDLEMMNSIDEAFDSEGRCMMLYPVSSETNGHWVCMIKRQNEIEFFDPYGKKPDTELKWMGSALRRELNLEQPVLTRLFNESGYKITYNIHDFQGTGSDINTCGRHCVVRLMFKNLSLNDYLKMIKSTGLPPDEFVSGLTYLEINK